VADSKEVLQSWHFCKWRLLPKRVTLAECPNPTSPALNRHFYLRVGHIHLAAKKVLGLDPVTDLLVAAAGQRLDVPDPSAVSRI
jgi:hypothetical protein